MNLTIATPSFTDVHPAFALSLAETYRVFPNVTWLHLPGCADIVLARNQLLHMFRHGSDDVILYIDADISWKIGDLEQITSALGGAHVAAGMYQMKVPGPAQFVGDQFVGDLLPSDCNEQTGYVGPGLDHRSYYRVASVGFGFFAMDRHAVEEAVKHCPSYCPVHGQNLTNQLSERAALLFRNEISETEFQPGVPRYRGEDVSACLTLRKAGFDIWCARETTLAHHAGRHAYNRQLDVDALAKRLAFQHDVMRRKAKGETLDQNELLQRQQRLPQGIARGNL